MRLKTSPKPLCLDIALLTRATSSLLVGATFALLSGGAFALGLGEINTATYLGQYLEAKISLVDGGRRYQASELSVRQILGKEARSLGIELVNSNYLFVLELTGEGEALGLRVRSRRPITEPYINLLVSLEWVSGSVYREYTLFLDPQPTVSEAVGSLAAIPQGGVGEKVGGRSVNVGVAPDQLGLKKASQGVLAGRSSSVAAPRVVDAATTHYRIRSGDTLSKIAEQWRQGTGETISSTSHWLFENNPHAFSGGSQDHLIAGSLLNMPESSQLPLAVPVADVPPVKQNQVSTVQRLVDTSRGRLHLAERRESLLTDPAQASRAQLSADLDGNRELMDKLRRENDDLRARLNKLEGSDYVQMLTRLVELQNLQIDRLREEASATPIDSAQLLVALAPPSERPVLRASITSELAPELTAAPVGALAASALAVNATSLITSAPAGVAIDEVMAASLSESLREPQHVELREWWQTGLLLGLPLLAVGLYLLMGLRLRSQSAGVVARGAAVEPLVDVDYWQPSATEGEGVRWPEGRMLNELADDVSILGDVVVPVVRIGSPEDLDKPLLLLDEVLDREFEALVEAADFDPACEFPDPDDALFDHALSDVGTGVDAQEQSVDADVASLEPDALQTAIVAAASDVDDAGVLSSINDSFEGLAGAGRADVHPCDIGDLPGIDQDFGLNDAVQNATLAAPSGSDLQEPEFELSLDQQTEFEEDWLDESSLPVDVFHAVGDKPAEVKADEEGGDEGFSSLGRRRDDADYIEDSLVDVAKVLPFQRRRSDAEVRKSIQAKTNDYTPPDEAYVVCDCDDDTVLSLDFNLIDDPEFSEQGLNVDGFESPDHDGAVAGRSDTPVTKGEVADIVAGMGDDAARDSDAISGVAGQPLFVDLQFRASNRDGGAPQVSPR